VIITNAAPSTTSDNALNAGGRGRESTGDGHLVHFPGPITPGGYDALLKTGVEIVTYIPNNAYLVYGDRAALTNQERGARMVSCNGRPRTARR
jgi:hypothetical protein